MENHQKLHRLLVVGGGAGGLELVTRLGRALGRKKKASVVLVDACTTHVWKPLLHEVAAGSLDSSHDELSYMAQARWNGFRFYPGALSGLDRKKKEIHLAPVHDENGAILRPGLTLEYDTLVLSVGSQSNDFGIAGVQEHCLFLDSRQQAERIHRTFVNRAFHSALAAGTQPSLHVAIIGAGATGVELAAALHHSVEMMAEYGPAQGVGNLHLTLIEGGARVLPALPERISAGVQTHLDRLGVRTLTNTLVSRVTAETVETRDGQSIRADMCIWAAGVKAPDLLANLDGLETNAFNQLVVSPELRTSQDPDIFALGDCASCTLTDADAQQFVVPPRAQSAHQQARHLACSLSARLQGKPLKPFRYRDYGSLISLSSGSAVGNLMGNLTGTVMLEGRLARLFYVLLYRRHQAELHGYGRTALLIARDFLERTTAPRVKLH
ncbi:MAG: NAD(P)/FAD-dependent oxidoreductase [Kistimonas sp.]|nr:NAD(P)/FAD-dependent oxidoreductase [Kistimonas sp.]